MKKPKFIITCEHASKRVPDCCSAFLLPPASEREQHRVYDWGARHVARKLAEKLHAPIYEGKITRLAIDLNRSIDHPELFSETVKAQSETLKARLIARYYFPFRSKVEKRIEEWIEHRFNVVHLSIHSFTPRLNGNLRAVDFGVLFDETRAFESALSREIFSYHSNKYDFLSTKSNTPYQGIDDGHATALRKVFPENYAGIEIEYSQSLDLKRQSERWADDLRDALRHAYAQGKKTIELCG